MSVSVKPNKKAVPRILLTLSFRFWILLLPGFSLFSCRQKLINDSIGLINFLDHQIKLLVVPGKLWFCFHHQKQAAYSFQGILSRGI